MIYYTQGEKNGRSNILSKKNNHIETRKIFNYNIFKANKNKLLLVNKPELGIIICIIRDNQK